MKGRTIAVVPTTESTFVQPHRLADLDELEALAHRVAERYRDVRREVDTNGNLFARHELQSALIEVRRLRRGAAAVEAELEAELAETRRRQARRPLRAARMERLGSAQAE